MLMGTKEKFIKTKLKNKITSNNIKGNCLEL